jgi:hypothetical protein
MDSSLKNASVVLAGGSCLLLFLGRLFSTYSGVVPVRGFWFITLLVFPLLCLWCGMLVRHRIGKPGPWLQIAVGMLTAVAFYFMRNTVHGPGIYGLCAEYAFSFLLGILLPWNHMLENGDRLGAKSAVLCVLTALGYAALFLVWQRFDSVVLTEHADMRQFLLVVMTNVLPLASIPPLVFAVEFACSAAGQWLGSRKWFFWVAAAASAFCFVGAVANLPYALWINNSFAVARVIRFFVQPVTVYLLVLLWRLIVRRIRTKTPA